MDKSVNWGMVLHEFREAYSLKQKALAQLLGVKQSTISHYENGTRLLGKKHRAKIIDIIRSQQIQPLVKHNQPETVVCAPTMFCDATSQFWRDHRLERSEWAGRSWRPWAGEEAYHRCDMSVIGGVFKGEIALMYGDFSISDVDGRPIYYHRIGFPQFDDGIVYKRSRLKRLDKPSFVEDRFISFDDLLTMP